NDDTDINLDGIKLPEHDLTVTGITAHPRHKMQKKPHQLEGFNFLLSNLITGNSGGCILAYAPGSGKTFMIICFMQSFLSQYPDARPLVVPGHSLTRFLFQESRECVSTKRHTLDSR
ncbi:hypothetical protein SOVF_122400, partial [Spinacia oleracea]